MQLRSRLEETLYQNRTDPHGVRPRRLTPGPSFPELPRNTLSPPPQAPQEYAPQPEYAPQAESYHQPAPPPEWTLPAPGWTHAPDLAPPDAAIPTIGGQIQAAQQVYEPLDTDTFLALMQGLPSLVAPPADSIIHPELTPLDTSEFAPVEDIREPERLEDMMSGLPAPELGL